MTFTVWRAPVPKVARGPVAATGLAILLVGLSVVGFRTAGAFESLELAAYDWYLRLRPFDSAPDPRILLVTITEDDIHRHGWPLSDGVVARALEMLAHYEPRAIGLDIYRDVPVYPGTGELHRLLMGSPSVIGVMKFGDDASVGVPPPSALRTAEHFGFNDVLVDPGGTVRRGVLFLDDGARTVYSLALRLAVLYLRREGITPQPDANDARQLRLGRTTIRPFEPNDGPYVGADARGYQFLLDFKGGRGPFRSISLTDLLSGRLEPLAARDKIVLIGVSAESVKDQFYTPYSRGLQTAQQMAGITIHAHVVSQLIRMALDGAAPMATARGWQNVSWILLWSAIGGLIGLKVRSPWRISLTAGGGVVGLGLIDFLAFWRGWWFPLVPPAMAALSSAAMVTAYVSYQEKMRRERAEREKAFLRRAFQHYVDPTVVEQILDHPERLRLGGERVDSTVLFADLQGFTRVAEGMAPEKLVAFLNEYLSAMTEVILTHRGMLNRTIGDAILALWGVPVPDPAHALGACCAALAMQHRLGELDRNWVAAGLPALSMRIGIQTGWMVVGNVGSAERFDYTAHGDNVNLASRLEEINKFYGTGIIVGEETARRVQATLELRELDVVRVVNRVEPVRIYECVAHRGGLTSDRRALLDTFGSGLQAYRKHDWVRAPKDYEQTLALAPADRPSQIYVERIRRFLADPPPEDWDGVHIAQSKEG